LRETPLSADQTIEDDGEDYFILRATVPRTAELNRWLLGWGPTMQVLGPPALREEIEARIREMYAQLGAALSSSCFRVSERHEAVAIVSRMLAAPGDTESQA
jgi:hypothetical protein